MHLYTAENNYVVHKAFFITLDSGKKAWLLLLLLQMNVNDIHSAQTNNIPNTEKVQIANL